MNSIEKYLERTDDFKYKIRPEFLDKNISDLSELKKYIDNENVIKIPFVSECLEEVYPYINMGIKKEVIDKSIEQGICVHEMISLSVKNRNEVKIRFHNNECDNPNHIQLAKRMITELNSFIYKYKIKRIFSENTFFYNEDDIKFIGTPDLILEGIGGFYIIDLKTSRTNYIEKYSAQLFLYKILLEFSNKVKVLKTFILNPREDIVIQESNNLSNQDKYKIFNFLRGQKS